MAFGIVEVVVAGAVSGPAGAASGNRTHPEAVNSREAAAAGGVTVCRWRKLTAGVTIAWS